MTTDIERQFFETFNIEKKQVDCGQPVRLGCEDCKTCKYSIYEYPQITDRILLELICIINRFDIYFDYYYQEEYHVLKETILEDSINLNCKLKQTDFSKLKQQVQALFKEG